MPGRGQEKNVSKKAALTLTRLQLILYISAVKVWAGVVGSGPYNTSLTATFRSSSMLEFQDAMGVAVLECCRNIPDGVLLFMPSYSLMDKLSRRWKV